MTWAAVQNYDIQFRIPLAFSHRTHKLCKLPNGVLALLISDPEDNASVCSVTVATGSHNDPKGVPGLAHLCEHMLFAAGSKKYPDVDKYHQTLSKTGGTHNAYTTGEQTTFHISVPNMNREGELEFDCILDMFSSFLKEPLFNSTAMNKEIYAIQSEHDSNVSSLSKILYQAIRLMANGNHPFSQFSTGNIHTLKNMPLVTGMNLRTLLVNYFETNFQPRNITVCIKGSQSVNILTKLALTNFGYIQSSRAAKGNVIRRSISKRDSIRSNGKKLKKIESFRILEKAWKAKYKDIKCFDDRNNFMIIKSNKQSTMRFLFPVNESGANFTPKELKIFSGIWRELFGDESKGSLHSYFIEKSWITETTTYISDFTYGVYGLILQFSLTASGWENLREIISKVFKGTLELVRWENLNSLSRILFEHTTIEYINYLYQEQEVLSSDFCSELTELLQHSLRTPELEYLFKESPNLIELNNDHSENLMTVTPWWFDQAMKFQNFINEFMKVTNVKLFLLGSELKHNAFFELGSQNKDWSTDAYYGFDYIKSHLNFKQIIDEPCTTVNDYSLALPSKNLFIPQFFQNLANLQQIFMEYSLRSRFAVLQPQVPTSMLPNQKPRLVNRSSHYEMWILPIDKEPESVASPDRIPKQSTVTFSIESLTMTPSSMNTMHLEILGEVLNFLLTSDLYPSLQLSYAYEIATSLKGDVQLCCTICGFSDGVVKITDYILSTLRLIGDPATANIVTNSLLRKARIQVRSKYEAASSEICVKLASMGLLIVLERGMWTLEDRLEALEDSDMSSFQQFCHEFVMNDSGNYLNLFVQGDMRYADEVNCLIHSKLTHHLNSSRCSTPTTDYRRSTTVLKPGVNYYVEYPGQGDDPNNSIVHFVQVGLRNDRAAFTLAHFTAYLMHLTLVPDLRYKKQIGYVVLGGLRIMTDTVGLHITVMSAGQCLDLEDKIDEYMMYLEDTVLNALTESQFEEIYLKPYIRLIGEHTVGEMDTSGGPTNLLSEIYPNVQNGHSSVLEGIDMKRHKQLWNLIQAKEYDFLQGNDILDRTVVQGLTLHRYMTFFKEKLSARSTTRSKISIMIDSPMKREEIMNRQMFLQMETFLKMKGFAIKDTELRDIVNKSQGSPTQLLRHLLAHFKTRGENWKLCRVIAKEVGKLLALGVRRSLTLRPTVPQRPSTTTTTTPPPRHRLPDADFFRRT
ncbi:Axl1p KNAG_0A07740 [Huiozyma naganishii CBS 8797]|uniref:Uncharacterized protein n=1 Tax=Huiozyma naganishii (strain ATCC MYA-139 / BCRC 22969 / CBS 8797 / KCTC 17520 / NBRC 10181 / NCYC 3082 / Yp74L-3) TaxID=1071383 RepID=J7S476_HUIN7|nr:hypothetical protein KNAG_0A07740 [Kazachstania naganishii CBS 8797]CCK68426.1 hypothetical protein KNAG_0A07740 [Kazachstania naganishii CBS 8797]